MKPSSGTVDEDVDTIGAMVTKNGLAAQISGEVVGPEDPRYDEIRRVHNGLIDKRPSVIVRCVSAEDVAAAVLYGREHGLEISVRGGGHNVAGRAVTEGGLMIDLAPMKRVDVDARSRIACAEPGVTWGEFDRAAGEHGLATTGGVVSSTGVAGLTLGGGLGNLMARHGLSIDNLLEAELVTADGRRLIASDDRHPDLFWALRGGGGNFGIVTSFAFRLHQLETVLGGAVVHDFADATDVLRRYRDTTPSISDDLVVGCGLLHGPKGGKVVATPLCHAGAAEEASREVAAFTESGAPIAVSVERMQYPVVNTLLDGAFPRGALNYWKSAFVPELTDQLVAALVTAYDQCPSPMSLIVIEHLHGEATRVPRDATAFPHRRTGYNLLILGQWSHPSVTEENISWTQETFESVRPFVSHARYVNYMGADDGSFVGEAFGVNLPRLVAAKRRYDPDNVFRLNQNIDPNLAVPIAG